MELKELKTKSEKEVLEFIRTKKQGKKFEMSGYESKNGECTVSNIALLNEFNMFGL